MKTNREKMLAQMSERDFQKQVQELLTLYGWKWYHAPDNRPVTAKNGKKYVQNIRAGFPDIVAVRDDRLLFIELKRESGKVSQDQREWLEALCVHGGTYVWYPHDMDEIKNQLKP